MRSAPLVAVGVLALSPFLLGAAPDDAGVKLDWPVACRVGVDCQIQNYVDHDPSPAVKDQACGTRTYDGHDGIDIRLPSTAAMRRGVDVLAAANGRVQGVRDGVADVSVDIAGPQSVAGRECGNGVIVEHAGGFVTQYCHLARGSIRVKAGDAVTAGQPVGHVGMSGLSDFPHLHIGVRKDTKAVDPFAYGAPANACGGGGRSLWRTTAPYEPRVVLNAAFATQTLTLASAEEGPPGPPVGGGPLLIAYVRALGLKGGDVQALTLTGPDGKVIGRADGQVVPRDQPLRLLFVGGRRPPQGWAKGRYTARYTVSVGGKTVLTRAFVATL
jgi:murein DD-endopeptidase MepM/ murein hydrolase activator NlpD